MGIRWSIYGEEWRSGQREGAGAYGEHMGEDTDYRRSLLDREESMSPHIGDLEHRRFAGVTGSTRCPISPYTIYGFQIASPDGLTHSPISTYRMIILTLAGGRVLS